MMCNHEEKFAIEQFALACERLNAFANGLRDLGRFQSVRTGADIRHYNSGWRLEKWVEADFDRQEGVVVAWWLEMGIKNDDWIVESHLSVCPDVLFVGLKNRIASSSSELTKQLAAAVDELAEALTKCPEFAAKVASYE